MRTLTRTLRIPVKSDENTTKILVDTMKEYSKAAQMGYNYGLSNKTTSRVKIHHGIYKDFRKQSPLNSQLVINGKNKGVDVLKSLKKKNTSKTKTSKKKKMKWKLPQVNFNSIIPIRYDYRCSTIHLEQRSVSLATISKRINLTFEIPRYYNKFVTWKFKSFELIYIHKRFFLHFVVEKPISSELLDSPHSGVFVGIDRGMRHLAVSSQKKFYSGSRLRGSKDKYFRLKRSLQKKGTRSARSKLRFSSGREKRFQKDMNHCITKDIISNIPANSTIILEDLSFIRKTGKRRRKTRSSREFHSWAFYQFQMFLEYKAVEKNIEVVYVNPAYTSQECSSCGYILKSNRNGSNFLCKSCNFSLNADLNASHNIKSRMFDTSYLLQLARRAIRMMSGASIIIPDVAS
ncbi:MAG: IS200/IS605 family element transposase accessory protein TnpB [Candidatus Heimdallarchaeota archaeon]|nr:IS200/IS605 family element transposase accessory protein TnpB [Candidatus Heimdallarchaeota archaeon]